MRMQYLAAMALALTLLNVKVSSAQNFNAANTKNGVEQIFLNVGFDPAVVLTLGYMHAVDCCGFETTVGYDLSVPMGDFDLRDLRFRWWTLTPLLSSDEWQVLGQFGLVGRTTQNDIYDGFNLGMDLGLHGGYYKEGWHLAFEGGYDKAILTHISHSDWYTDNFYADAVDGWYLDTGGIWRAGITTGFKINNTELQLRAGMRLSEGEGNLIPPSYITIGASHTIN